MSLVATVEDFEQGGLYGSADGGYHEYPFFASRANGLKGRAAPHHQGVAVWGCGYGYLVRQCVQAGYNAFGFDASAYAINKGKTLMPEIADRLFVRDVLNSADTTVAHQDAGLSGGFAVVVSEDMLPCLSDAEIAVALPLVRATAKSNLIVHVVTPSDYLIETSSPDQRLNWKTTAEWKVLLDPDFVYDAVADQAV